ncbi:Protein of unknown function [Albimonas donghaensis]|uniref:DUF2798 domain-containing protein n=1 Tax=Albimonas donghaensis TaxID=356660 RepID=A0A1H2YU91_9RHOB|nr:DUF2798 domain-containing protein [Albimonas donghaensis]SDX08716.1 Protein of unknown function [Albimonas donghaensis]
MHPRFAPILFGLLLSGLMSLIVSGVAIFRALGVNAEAAVIWLAETWPTSWAVAFPTVLVVAPVVRRMVAKLVRAPASGEGPQA